MKKMNMTQRKQLAGWVFLIPAMALIVCLSIYPMIQAFITSFCT